MSAGSVLLEVHLHLSIFVYMFIKAKVSMSSGIDENECVQRPLSFMCHLFSVTLASNAPI